MTEKPSRTYSVAQAAQALGVTPKTIRNRLKRGDLQAEKLPTKGGFTYRVVLPEAPPRMEGEVEEPASPTILALLAEIRRLEGELMQATAAASRYQERAAHLEATQKLLEAPKRQPWYKRILGQDRS